MTEVKQHHVTIKGVKDGLLFVLDDRCELADLYTELRHKIEKTHKQFLSGPIIHVHVKLGARQISEEEKETIRSILSQKGNLLIQSIESDIPGPPMRPEEIQMVKGMVRSGQTLHHAGNLLFLGDVNPGGTLTCTGSIYVMGSLRGMAHAGIEGDESAVIAASFLRPTQLRIADVISRPPDEWGLDDSSSFMDCAYIKEGKMEINKISHMYRQI